jgi:MFS transporter, MCT family, solute carrier family 16 (monocarboxylic acid transporters), member 10
MTYVPCFGVIAHHFQRKRALAMGISTSGAPVGSVVYAIMLNRLFHGSVGFHNGVRVSAVVNFGLFAIALSMMRTRLPPKDVGTAIPLAHFIRDLPYVAAVLGYVSPFSQIGGSQLAFRGSFFNFSAYFPFFCLQLDAVTHAIEPNLAFYLVRTQVTIVTL